MKISLQETILLSISLFATSCSNNSGITNLGDKTFIHNEKIYRLIDDELIQIGNLKASEIRIHNLKNPELRDLGKSSVFFVKKESYATVEVLYRGNILYFKFRLHELNDLKDNYFPGTFTVSFLDEHDFILNSTEISTTDLIGLNDDNNKISGYVYNGKVELNAIINSAIASFDVSSTVRKIGK